MSSQSAEVFGGNRMVPAREELRRFFDVRARRTQGCLTCRRRKVKCDQRRPTCERCKKGMHKCLGYDEPFLFVNQALPSGEQPTSKKTADEHKQFWGRYEDFVAGKSSTPPLAATPEEMAISPISPVVPLTGFKDNIVISHLVSNLRIGMEQNPESSNDAPTMRSAMESFGGQTAAYISGLGVAEAYFSRIHKVDDMLLHSGVLHGQALRRLRVDLDSLDESVDKSSVFLSLWTAYFLSLYELVASSSTSRWLQHVQGVSALIQMLGPQSFQSSSANALYEVKRPLLGVVHIIMRKRCYLEYPEWINTPWAQAPEGKPPGSWLMDTFVRVPGLLEDADKLGAAAAQGENVATARQELQNKIVAAIQHLSESRWMWETEYPRVCWRTRTNPHATACLDEEGKILFETSLNFVGLKRTFEILFYNVSRLLLYRLSELAEVSDDSISDVQHAWQRNGPFLNPLLLPGVGTRESHALEICRIVDYLLGGAENNHGAYVLLFPLRVARMHLEGIPKVHAWIGRLLTSFAEEKGLKIGLHLVAATESSSTAGQTE